MRLRIEIYLYILLIILTMGMISLGGATRLTGSGLSIVNWDLIMGVFPPMTEKDWQKSFELYQKYPEYQKINFHMTVDQFKSIFYYEYFHRLLGRVIGLFSFILMNLVLWGKSPKRKKIESVLLFVLVGLQGLMGWYMVKSGLVDLPRVSHYRLLAHFFLAFIFLTLLGYLLHKTLMARQKSVTLKNDRPASRLLNIFVNLTIIAFIIQIIFGALLAGLDGGLVSNSYPLMFDSWIPENLMLFPGSSLSKIFDNPVFINFFHRHWGIATAGLMITTGILTLKSPDEVESRPYHHAIPWLGIGLILLAVLQPMIGIMTLVMQVPVKLGVLHQFLAVVIWADLFTLKLLSRTAILKPSPDRQ